MKKPMRSYGTALLAAALVAVGAQWTSHPSYVTHRNFSCAFQSANFNCWLLDVDGDGNATSSRSELCAGLHYQPTPEIDPRFLWDKFDGRTIYFEGDSVMSQSFANLACRLEPFLLSFALIRAPDSPCSNFNLCLPRSAKHPYDGATARFGDHNRSVEVLYVNAVVPTVASMATALSRLARGDVYVFNYGLHLHVITDQYKDITSALEEALPLVTALRANGVHVVWRETTAPHFAASAQLSGLWSPDLRDAQTAYAARCADAEDLDRDAAWGQSTNAVSTPFWAAHDVPVLHVWNATFLAPAACHIGGGRDCVHYCEPGVLNAVTDALIVHLLLEL